MKQTEHNSCDQFLAESIATFELILRTIEL
jgi:hypothetical protein